MYWSIFSDNNNRNGTIAQIDSLKLFKLFECFSSIKNVYP